jgi:hypothetical protein
LVTRQIGIMNADQTALEWVTLEDAQLRLDIATARRQQESWTARIPVRFGPDALNIVPLPETYQAATAEQRRWLAMSQAEFTRFLAGRNAAILAEEQGNQ